jgi:hypothetical protein
MRAATCAILVGLLVTATLLSTPTRGILTIFPVAAESVTRGTSTGFSNEADNDGGTDTKTEAGTSRTTTLTLLPSSDSANSWLTATPCQTDATAFDELDEDPNDGDTTCRRATVSATNALVDTHMGDVAGGPLGVIDDYDVTAIAETRLETAGQDGSPNCTTFVLCGLLQLTGGGCAPNPSTDLFYETSTTGALYVTRSKLYESCMLAGASAVEWTEARINNLRIAQSCEDGAGGGSTTCRTTQHKITVDVAYRDDFYVDFTSTFVNVRGTNLALLYECTTTDQSTTDLRALLNSDVQGTLTCDGASRSLPLVGASGVVLLQVQSATQSGDATESTYAFDWLVLQADVAPDSGGGDAFMLECAAGIWDLDCTVALNESILEVRIELTIWYVDGQRADTKYNADGIRIVRATLPGFSIVHTYSIVVLVGLNNGQLVELRTEVEQNNVWLVVLLIFAGIAIGTLALLRRRPQAPRQERRDNPRKELASRRKTNALIAILAVVAVFALVGGPPTARADDTPTDSYVSVTAEVEDVAYTWDLVTIRVDSALLVNQSGNLTMVPSSHVIELEVIDESADLVVLRRTLPLFNGSVETRIQVAPEWTSSRIRIEARDPATGLVGEARFRTRMSDAYLAYLIKLAIWQALVAGDAKADEQIGHAQLVAGTATVLAIVLTIVLGVRADHRRSKRVNTVSVWDAFARRTFPYSLPTEELYVWLDARRTWAPEAARSFEDHRKDAMIVKLEAQREEITKEIEGVRAGAIA